MKKSLKKKKGFTLIELIIVIAILGILAAIAIPKFANTQASARKKADIASAKMLADTAAMLIADESIYPTIQNDTGTIQDSQTKGGYGSFALDPNSPATEGSAYLIEKQVNSVPKVQATSGNFTVAIEQNTGKVTVTVGGLEVYPNTHNNWK